MPELFEHQKEGIAFLREKPRAILADEMGLGKTRQAIVATGNEPGILVVCPASLKINWRREILHVHKGADVHLVESGPEETLPAAQWLIINYDMLPKYKEQILAMVADGRLTTAVIDEAHYIKGKKTIRATTTLEIVEGMERVYALTGTPIMNRPIELFNLLRAIKHPLGKNRTFYGKRYCGAYLKQIFLKTGRVIRFWDETGATRLPELRELTKDAILRRTKEEVLDLPDKIISVQICEFDKEGKREYDNAWDNYLAWIEANPQEGKSIENVLSAQHLVELTKLKQVGSRAKIGRIVSDIRNAVEQGEKVIVFSQYTGTIDRIAEQLREVAKATRYADAKEPIGYVTLTGQHSAQERQDAVDRFQNDPETKVFISNIKAGGVGITLTAASIVMFADMDWSPEIHSQAEDRAHRIGQGGTVNVYYYILADTIEEDIVDILERKKGIIKAVMDGTQDAEYQSSMAAEFLDRLAQRLGTTR